jgi:hypothetical protein
MYFNLYWYKGIQICVNLWKSQFETHNQGIAFEPSLVHGTHQGILLLKGFSIDILLLLLVEDEEIQEKTGGGS